MPTLGVFAAKTDEERRILCVRIHWRTAGRLSAKFGRLSANLRLSAAPIE